MRTPLFFRKVRLVSIGPLAIAEKRERELIYYVDLNQNTKRNKLQMQIKKRNLKCRGYSENDCRICR